MNTYVLFPLNKFTCKLCITNTLALLAPNCYLDVLMTIKQTSKLRGACDEERRIFKLS